MNNKLFFLIAALFITSYIFAQKGDPIALKINENPVYKSQLEEAYKKSNKLKKESLSSFLKSYIDFRLNVEEAKAQHLDTTVAYRRDLSSARAQLATKYTQDTQFEDDYISMIYNRMQQDVEINHVLLPFEQEVILPSDTVTLYNKALNLRKELLKNGFGSYANSGTTLALDNERRNGYLGWVMPFMLSAKIEDAIYKLSVGEVSLPIRTPKGYHIVQTISKRPAVGAVEVEQVVFNFPTVPPTQQQIDSVRQVVQREYDNIRTPADFQSICDEFSYVYKTGDKGCNFGIVGLDSKYPSNFINAAFNLKKIGDVSSPVLSDYGFHLIRLVDKVSLPALDSMKLQLRKRVLGGDKVENLIKERRRRLMSEFNQTINKNAYSELNSIANHTSPQDSSFLSFIKNEDDLLFTIDAKNNYYVKDFADYIRYRQKQLQKKPNELEVIKVVDVVKYSLSTDVLKEYFDAFLYEMLSDYAYSTLEERYPDFKNVMNNFSDDLLLYAVKNNNVWEKSKSDNIGLADYFNKHREKYALDGTKYKGVVVYCKNEDSLKECERLSKKYSQQSQFIEQLKELNKEKMLMLFELGLWTKGENAFVDHKVFEGKEPTLRKGYPFFFVRGEFIDTPQDFTDVRSAVEYDYQQALEKEWDEYLWNKYKVEKNESVLKTIK